MTETTTRPASLDLSNWQQGDHVNWSFQHLSELIPVAEIAADGGGPDLPTGLEADLNIPAARLGEGIDTVAGVLDDTQTDGFLVLHEGAVYRVQAVEALYDLGRMHHVEVTQVG